MDEALKSATNNNISQAFDNLNVAFPVMVRKIMVATMLKSKIGFSNMEAWVLEGLATSGWNPSEISKMFSISKPNVTTLINKLVDGGYVQRTHDEKDRRIVRINVTDKGRKLIIKRHKIVKKYVLNTFSKLSDDELIEISKSLSNFNNLVTRLNELF
jgi:DNA-binding MarR family transcriptional regulator